MLSIRLSQCAQCAMPVQVGSRGPSINVFCRSCNKVRRADRRRAKEGVKVRAGLPAICVDCRATFQTARGAPVRCVPCRKNRRRKDDRDRRRALRQTSPAYRISDTLKVQIRQSLRGTKNGRSWEAIVGYTLAELMAHLAAQFQPGMCFENHGEWHIDHIRPLCSFQFQTPDDPQFREAWALTNLQPLWAVDNLRKGGRWAA